MNINRVILIRHGQSEWNLLNKFTGWNDVNLSLLGRKEAKKAADLIKKNGFVFDCAFTSMLKRAIHTLWIVLESLNLSWIPVKKLWQLNERHYGALQGMNKDEIVAKYGEEKVHSWRRSYDCSPPKIEFSDSRFPGNDFRYADMRKDLLPIGESLKTTEKRVIQCWKNLLYPKIKIRKKILIVAHGNSLRALIKYLGNIDDFSISNIDIPTGKPIVYEFSKAGEPMKYYFL